jgi:hypothetical protein
MMETEVKVIDIHLKNIKKKLSLKRLVLLSYYNDSLNNKRKDSSSLIL